MSAFGASPHPSELTVSSPRERVLAALSDEPATARVLRKRCGMRTATLSDVLAQLVSEGVVEKTQDGYQRVA